MLDDPYYASAPIVIPDRPVVLSGPLSARVPLTGALLSTLTGLPLVDLERALAHEAGQSPARLRSELGSVVAARLAARLLDRVLRERPPPIIVLGPDTLEDPGCRARVLAGGRLFVLGDGDVPVEGGEGVALAGHHPHRIAALLLSRLQPGR